MLDTNSVFDTPTTSFQRMFSGFLFPMLIGYSPMFSNWLFDFQRSLVLQRAQTTDYELFKLTKVEMMFAKYYTLLRLPGKGGKFVPVLIPPKTLEVIDIMINDDKLKSDNYFFQTEGGEQFYRTIDVLRKYTEEFKLQDKKVFRSTKLRKYLATAAQFLDLPQNQRVGWPTSWDTTWMFTTSTAGCTLLL